MGTSKTRHEELYPNAKITLALSTVELPMSYDINIIVTNDNDETAIVGTHPPPIEEPQVIFNDQQFFNVLTRSEQITFILGEMNYLSEGPSPYRFITKLINYVTTKIPIMEASTYCEDILTLDETQNPIVYTNDQFLFIAAQERPLVPDLLLNHEWLHGQRYHEFDDTASRTTIQYESDDFPDHISESASSSHISESQDEQDDI